MKTLLIMQLFQIINKTSCKIVIKSGYAVAIDMLWLLICCGYPNYKAQGTFVIIFFICSDLYNCLRSHCTVALRTENEKKTNILTASRILAVAMYFLHGHPRNFKFRPKDQQYGPYFQTIFPFLMTML